MAGTLATGGGSLDEADVKYLAGRLADGSVVLFTGAGFSRLARNADGNALPLGQELAQALWAIAFPGSEYDGASALSDVFDVAVRQGQTATGNLLRRLLTVPRGSVPKIYETWFSMPWKCHYTVNIDNLDSAVAIDYRLPRQTQPLSALEEQSPPADSGQLQSIHLNGRVEDFPNVTLSDLQYGERTASPDPWYRMLVNDLSTRCVVFVGTRLDEPSLWQHIELRRLRQRGHREQRPRGFLVTPTVPRAREKMLEQFNIVWIPMGQEDFAAQVLESLSDAAVAGLGGLAARQERSRAFGRIESVSELRALPPTEPREYLLGRDPEWGDIGSQGFAVMRDFESGLADEFDQTGRRILFITGTAGAGKSTTLKRIALLYDASGLRTFSLSTDTDVALPRVRAEVGATGVEILAIDDVDAFGAATPSFLQSLLLDNDRLRILAAVRSSRFRRLGLHEELADALHEVTVPNLQDGDIELLLDALTTANRLGALRGLTRPQQAAVFRDKAGRELLVAMIEATSGELFEKRIGEECDDLGESIGYQYAALSLATHFRYGLARDEVLDVVNGDPNASLNDFKYLVDHHLLTEKAGLYRVRHRYIAERAVDYFRARGQIADPIGSLLWVMAARVTADSPRYARERRLLTSLLSHEFLIRLDLTQAQARSIYNGVEDLLSWDSHYWLQRGSFEVERGDINLAKNFLDQARSLSDDFMVRTEWAYMTIKRAAMTPETSDAQERVDEAFGELEEAIRVRGRVDSYPYHVLGSQGLSWARRAPMDTPVRRQFLGRILAIVRDGSHLHPMNPELGRLAKDIEYDYLMTSTVDETG